MSNTNYGDLGKKIGGIEIRSMDFDERIYEFMDGPLRLCFKETYYLCEQ